jgi:N-acetylmuramoyl-L-alanine amidase
MSKNNMTIKMTCGKKYAYVNGVKKKLSAAPVAVRYVKKKKTKLLVPVKFVCEQLGFNYSISGSTITVSDAIIVEYNNTVKRSKVVGTLSYNEKENQLSTMPVIKLGSTIYIPAEEVFQTIAGIDYNYDSESGKLSLSNEATGKQVELTLNQKTMTVNGVSQALSTPMYMVTRKDTGATVLCVPAKKVAKQLGYSYNWNSTKSLVSIHDLTYFDWKTTQTNMTDANINYITEAKATYNPDIHAISFAITGSNTAIMDQVSVVRNDNVTTVTIPASSKYCLEQYSFSKFVNTLEKFEVVEDGSGNIIMTITGYSANDFAYSSLDGTLTINIMTEYIGDYALKIMKPTGVSIANVSNQDLYNSKKFKITISGNYVDYLNQNPIVINSDVITDVTTSLSSDEANTVITITTSKLQGYKIYENSDSFVVSVGNPRTIYKNIVVLDAGHGGYDAGATSRGTKEKDLNYKIIYTLMKDYYSSNAPDTKVYWTRTTDTFITLANRAAFASKVGADIFISLHMNSASNTSANGTEVYYSTNNNSASFSGFKSQTMATLFKNNLIATLGTKNRGVKTAGYYVIKRNTVPAVLIELGFISGNSDYYNLTNLTFQKKSAKVIYDTITNIFTNYPTGR